MERKKEVWLMGSASALMLAAVIAALISAQWKHENVPFLALGAILVLTVVKSRWVIMDFMGLRHERSKLSAGLVGWVAFFAMAAAAKAALATIAF